MLYLTLLCVLYAFVNTLLFGILLRIPIIFSDAESKISITGVCEQVYCYGAFFSLNISEHLVWAQKYAKTLKSIGITPRLSL